MPDRRRIKFSDIGRKCLAWALRQAWVQEKKAARIAAIPADAKAQRIATLQTLIAYAGYIDHGPTWRATIAAQRSEIRQLQPVSAGGPVFGLVARVDSVQLAGFNRFSLEKRPMPDFTVIDGGGPEGRDRLFAEQEFRQALREAAANMLRIIRGAGKSYALLNQMSDVVAAAVKIRDLTGQLPTDILETVLHGESETEATIWEKRRTGKIDEATIARWHEDGTIDRQYAEGNIKAGVLQIIASQLVRQIPQERAGESEMNDGINKAIAAREKSRKYWQAKYPAPTKAGRKKRKPATRRFGSRLGKQETD